MLLGKLLDVKRRDWSLPEIFLSEGRRGLVWDYDYDYVLGFWNYRFTQLFKEIAVVIVIVVVID